MQQTIETLAKSFSPNESQAILSISSEKIIERLLSFVESDQDILEKFNDHFKKQNNNERFHEDFAQRIKEGFQDDETWSLDISVARWILPRLKRYREISKEALLTTTEYDEGLDKCVKAFEAIANEECCLMGETNHPQVSEGLDWFRQNFFTLWW